jgi:MFS family permease
MSSALQVLGVVARNRQLRRVELAYATFNSAEWATWIAMLVYAYSHGGVTASGLVATGMLVPAALLAPVAAAIGDRFAPGKALLAGYVLQATTCAAVAVTLTSHAPAPLVYALLVGPAVAFTMTRPTQAAFAPGLAHTPRELAATNVASGWVESISIFVAPVVAGVVLAVRGPDLVFALMGAGCALGAILVLPLRNAVAAAPADAPGGTSRFDSALAAVRSDPPARLLVLLLGGQCIALGALDVLYVELARGVLHRGGDWAGYFNGAAGAGGVLAVAVTARLVGRPRLANLLVASLAVWSIAFIALAVHPTVIGALLLLVVAGAAAVTFSVMGRTLLQRIARPGLLGRVFGLLEGVQMAGYAVGALLAPGLVAVGGSAFAFVGVGLLLPLMAVFAFRPLLEIDRHATVPVVEIALLRSLSLFSSLDAPTLESLARSLEPLAVAGGTDVVSEGDPGERFYAIADGEADVTASGNHLASLARGDFFGEIALMYDVPRTATVTARTDLQLYSLEREPFLLALTGHPEVQGVAEQLAQERLERMPTVG